MKPLPQSGTFDKIAPSRTIAIASVVDMLRDGSNKLKSNEQKSI